MFSINLLRLAPFLRQIFALQFFFSPQLYVDSCFCLFLREFWLIYTVHFNCIFTFIRLNACCFPIIKKLYKTISLFFLLMFCIIFVSAPAPFLDLLNNGLFYWSFPVITLGWLFGCPSSFPYSSFCLMGFYFYFYKLLLFFWLSLFFILFFVLSL